MLVIPQIVPVSALSVEASSISIPVTLVTTPLRLLVAKFNTLKLPELLSLIPPVLPLCLIPAVVLVPSDDVFPLLIVW